MGDIMSDSHSLSDDIGMQSDLTPSDTQSGRRYRCSKCGGVVRAHWFDGGSFEIGCDCTTVPVVPQMEQTDTPSNWFVEREMCCRNVDVSTLSVSHGGSLRADYCCPDCGATYTYDGSMVNPPDIDMGGETIGSESNASAEPDRENEQLPTNAPPMHDEWSGVEVWTDGAIRYPVPGSWSVDEHNKTRVRWRHDSGKTLLRTSSQLHGASASFEFAYDGVPVYQIESGPDFSRVRAFTVWLLKETEVDRELSHQDVIDLIRGKQNHSLGSFV